uniref:Glutathione-S-transferase-like-1 protein n=1 Tax=Coenobita clypeatus TaxID=474045 RepID=W6MEZ5_9EUCA
MTTCDFYYLLLSPPCRSVMLTAEAVGVKLNLKKVDIFKGEQMKPEFIAINPQHCIPTLVDGDLVLWESRPICNYLASKYGKDDSLFPNDPRKRAEVERLHYFDMGTLFFRFGEYVFPVLFRGEKSFNPEKLEKLHEALGWLNTWLAGHDFAVGNNITVADHSLSATVSTFKAAGIDLDRHPNVVAWLKRCEAKMPGYSEINTAGVEEWGQMFRSRCNL